MKIFLKGFCIGLLCLSLLGLLWFLVLQPGLTNGEAQALKKEYAQPLPGAESSGVLPAGKEQLEPESLVDLPALQTEYPDIKGWISIPGTCVDYPVLQSSADDPEYYLRRTYKGDDGARVHLHQLFGVGVELRDPALPLPQQGFHQIGARKGVGDDVLDLRGVAVDDVPGFFPFLKHTDVFQTEEEKITPQQTDQQDAEGIQDAPAVPAFPQDAGVERPSLSVPYQSLHRHSSNALMRGKVLQADKHIL